MTKTIIAITFASVIVACGSSATSGPEEVRNEDSGSTSNDSGHVGDSGTTDTLPSADVGVLPDSKPIDSAPIDTGTTVDTKPCTPEASIDEACKSTDGLPRCGFLPDGCGGTFNCGTCSEGACGLPPDGGPPECAGCYMGEGRTCTLDPSGLSGFVIACSDGYTPSNEDCSAIPSTITGYLEWCCKNPK